MQYKFETGNRVRTIDKRWSNVIIGTVEGYVVDQDAVWYIVHFGANGRINKGISIPMSEQFLELWYGTPRQQHILDWFGFRGWGCWCSGPCDHEVPIEGSIKVRFSRWVHGWLVRIFKVSLLS